MGTIYCVKRSAFENRLPFSYMNLAVKGDAVLFCQDGVFPLSTGHEELNEVLKAKKAQGVEFFALDADVKARAVKVPSDVAVVDYDGFIDLLDHYQRVIG